MRKLLYSLLLLLAPVASLFAQSVLESSLERYSKIFREKLYVHTDKDCYTAGELMWFKVYDVDATRHHLSGLSKVAYVEVLDAQHRAVMQTKVALEGGTGNGSLYVPVPLGTGTYQLRAYTSWMKNFDVTGFFTKNLVVLGMRKATPVLPDDQPKYDIRFYPESGHLVKTLENRIAFSVSSAVGRTVAFSGAVVDQFNDTAARFTPKRDGMGSFLMTPLESRVYYAVIRMQDGSIVKTKLPEVEHEGYVMQVNDAGTDLRIRVSATVNATGNVYLLGHTRQVVKVGESKALENGKAEFTVSKAKLGEGVTHFTLFNMDRQPLCERLYFKRPQTLSPVISTDRATYGQREKVTLSVQTPGTVSASMAIYRIDSLQQPLGNDITASLYFDADAGGYTAYAGAYLADPTAAGDEALDMLMLTRGWRRFRWQDVLSSTTPAFRYLPELNGHLVTGRVTDARGNRVQQRVGTYLSVPGTTLKFYTSLSDTMGNVRYEVRNFYGAGELIAQTDGQKDSIYRIDINSPFADSSSSDYWPQASFTRGEADLLLRHHIDVQVQQAFTGRQMRKTVPHDTDSSAFYGKPDGRYLLDDFTRFTTIEEVLREYVPGVNVRKRDGRFVLYNLDGLTRNMFTTSPLVLLDGVPVFNTEKIMAYDPLKVRKLEVITKRYYLGPLYFDGILSFTTYKGDIAGYELDPNATVIDYEGLQAEREFYQPAYDSEAALASRLPDYRNLLYWQPNAGKNGTESFYTSDLPGRYAVVLQALGADGKTGSKVIYFDVKE